MSEHVELLTKVANLSMLTFMVTNMLGFGMRLSLAEILKPLREIIDEAFGRGGAPT
jgi:hypothetical protein